MKDHFTQCGKTIDNECIRILDSSTKSDSYLLTLEALWIRDIKPQMNTKDEFKRRELIIKI